MCKHEESVAVWRSIRRKRTSTVKDQIIEKPRPYSTSLYDSKRPSALSSEAKVGEALRCERPFFQSCDAFGSLAASPTYRERAEGVLGMQGTTHISGLVAGYQKREDQEVWPTHGLFGTGGMASRSLIF